MSNESIHYGLRDGIATIRIDDGKRNALSPEVLREIYAALDRAEADGAVVILTGREDVFSAGFDLNVMRRGGTRALGMLRSGYALTARVLAYPHPVPYPISSAGSFACPFTTRFAVTSREAAACRRPGLRLRG